MDITNPRVLYLKAALFLFAGLLAGGLILLEHPRLKTALLLALCIWCFARAYYFVFYVIQHYIEPEFRYAGLWAFVRHRLSHRGRRA